MKARNVTRAATLARTIWWDVEATDPDDLADLLSRVTHLGARHNAGSGHVSHWSLDDVDGDWSDRDWPPAVACRAPYWHPSRRRPDDD